MIYDQSDTLKYLHQSMQKAPMVLFLGSGVMHDITDTWQDLLIELIGKALIYRFGNYFDSDFLEQITADIVHQYSTYDQANLVKHLLKERYMLFVRGEIYKNYPDFENADSDIRNKNKIFMKVCELCLKEWVIAVVNYNYDDLIETCINKISENRNVRGKSSDQKSVRKAVSQVGRLLYNPYGNQFLPIYHVHGLLPHENRSQLKEEDGFVLSRDEYFESMTDAYSWQTTTQLHFLRNNTCLFVGASLEDWNMLRIINLACKYTKSTNIFSILAEESFTAENKQERDFLVHMKADILIENGINPIIVPKFDDIPKLLQEDIIDQIDHGRNKYV